MSDDEPISDYEIASGEYPAELLQEDRWFLWKYDQGRKIPRAPWATGGDQWVSFKDAEMWTDFETADDYRQKLSGFDMASCIPPYEENSTKRLVLFDFDNCRDPETGNIHPHAWSFIVGEDREPMHGALSTSGTGIHGYAWASVPEGYKVSWTRELADWDTFGGYEKSPFDEPPELECYAADRFLALTGDHISGTPHSVPDLTDTVHEMFARFGEERTVGTEREPSVSREEIGDIDSTGDVEEIYDAIAHVRPGDIRLRSTVTNERADGTLSMDPSWETSESGTRLAQLDDCWLYRKGNHRLDALQVVALEERIITDASEYPGGSDFFDSVDALRERGAHIPELVRPTAPTAAEEIEAAAEATDGGVAVDEPAGAAERPSQTPGERARERLRHRVVVPLDPPEGHEGEEIDKRTAVDRTANIYHEEFSWLRPRSDTRGWRATLYNYVREEGIYEPHGEAEIERMIDAHLGPLADNQFVNEVVAKVERKARVRAKRLDEPPERLVVANGILDLTTGELHGHTPAEFHRTRLDVEYDPDAECEAIDDFLHDVVQEADVPRLYRFIAHALYRGYPESKAAMLLGEGSNGKTTFLNLVEEFLGEFNVAHESLKKLNEHEWAPARLNGNLANIDADMSDQSPDSMGMFKRLTGGDPIHGEVKFEKPIKFTNHATLMFACNEMPVLHDDTRGNWRRWQLIQFPYVFDEEDSAAKDPEPEEVLEERLFDEEEFAGLLARCVEEISAWADGRAFFPDADSWETTRNKMRKAAEPVYDFAHVCLRPSDEGSVRKSEVRRAYQEYATQNGLKKLGPEEFGKRLLNLRDFSIETKRIRDDTGGRPRVYAGVELTERGKQILEGDDGPDDGQQTGLGSAHGRRAKIDRVKEVLRKNGDEMERDDLLASYAGRHDVDPESAEDALQTALKNGDVLDAGGGLIRTT